MNLRIHEASSSLPHEGKIAETPAVIDAAESMAECEAETDQTSSLSIHGFLSEGAAVRYESRSIGGARRF